MKYRIMKKWVKALRSGEYKQGKDVLHDKENKFCCLGVLCSLANKENICELTDNIYGSYYYDDKTGTLPDSVIKWSGMQTPTGKRLGKRKELIELNDFNKYSFKRLANIIEKEYKDL